MDVGLLMAGAVTPASGAANVLINQGPIGALAVVIGLIGWMGWRRERDRADAEVLRADAERAAKDALVREFLDKAVPALVESAHAVRDFVDLARSERRSERR